jgi:putative transposase
VAHSRRVESIRRLLREQGYQVAARTYREWHRPSRPIAGRTVTDARVQNAVRDAAWSTGTDGVRRLAPEGLYGRRKVTAHLRRTSTRDASAGAVDRAMRALGLRVVRPAGATDKCDPVGEGSLIYVDFAGDFGDRTRGLD